MKTYTILFASVLMLTLHSCKINTTKNTEEVTTTENLYNAKWKLVELNGKPVADKINGKEPFLSFDKTTKRYSASGGCNGIGGNFELKKGQEIKFSPGVSTMMACMDMSIEQGLRDVFQNADNYGIQDGILSLRKTKNTTLAKFTAITQQNASVLEGTWELDYVASQGESFENLYPNKRPTLTFNITENKASGNGSCNNYFSTFRIDGSSISFGPIGATKMFCEGNGETVFFQNLEKVNKFDVHENQLHFIMGDIAIMRFKKK